jgi:hypothetical protein
VAAIEGEAPVQSDAVVEELEAQHNAWAWRAAARAAEHDTRNA